MSATASSSSGLFSRLMSNFHSSSQPNEETSRTSTATIATASAVTSTTRVPLESIVVSHQTSGTTTRSGGPGPPPPPSHHRVNHVISLQALEHNYTCAETAAHRQRCNVIVVVKADGYGHGAIATALHLADTCGADAFATATLEEAIALRKAFEQNQPGKWSKELASLFHAPATNQQHLSSSATTTATLASTSRSNSPTSHVLRPAKIRILVLGPPVGFPRCFDDYYYHNVEVSISGPEVAKALMEWIVDETERKRNFVQQAANESKAAAMTMAARESEKRESLNEPTTVRISHPSSTLGNVQGQDLAKEVRAILMNHQKGPIPTGLPKSTADSSVASAASSVASDQMIQNHHHAPLLPSGAATPKQQVFEGIEAAAKISRHREWKAARANVLVNEDDKVERALSKMPQQLPPQQLVNRKRLRWHALVETGMGRLGFRTEVPALANDDHKDTVEVLKELVDAEIHQNAPVEFFGMCTHMADSQSTGYTYEQIAKFVDLLKRVRQAGIFVPTVSTDNSAALLTQGLAHFDPKQILSQAHSDTRGYVRIGGAIYGQRPAFKQLRPVSTLVASVRHVAVLKKGESVGYDRAYTSPYDVRIATLTIGFADGYPRDLGNGVGKVVIRGTAFPVAGNVCMDMLMVELGPTDDKEGPGSQVVVGDTAVLWGPLDEDDGEGLVRLQDVAATLKTTQSALTCGLDKIRVRREFV